MQLTSIKQNDTKSANISRFKEDLLRRIKENTTYNESVLEHKEVFDKLEILDGKLILRLLKYTGEQDNDGLLLERKFKAFETEGGKQASKIEDWDFSMKAVVIKKPEQDYIDALTNTELKYRYAKLDVGDVVWLPMTLMNDSNAVFIHERNYPVQGFEGYLAVHVGSVQMKETKVA
jgi:hypothetical protein